MADGISLSMFTAPFKASVADWNHATDKASMYALRATGRAMVRTIKPHVPVYKGTDPRAAAESGNLKKSVRNAKRLTRVGLGDYSLKVGPFGTKKAGTVVVRYGGNGRLSSIRLARAGVSYYTTTQATRNKAARQGNSTRGQVRGVQLYRGAQEVRFGYMAAGVRDSASIAKGIYEDAYYKAWKKFM